MSKKRGPPYPLIVGRNPREAMDAGDPAYDRMRKTMEEAAARARAKSWRLRDKWVKRAIEMLAEHGVSCIEELPEDALAELEKKARNAFSFVYF